MASLRSHSQIQSRSGSSTSQSGLVALPGIKLGLCPGPGSGLGCFPGWESVGAWDLSRAALPTALPQA